MRASRRERSGGAWLVPVAGLLLGACSGPSGGGVAPRAALHEVRAWAVQLQGLERPGAVAALERAPYDLVVIEPTRSVVGMEGFDTRGVVERLRASRGAGRGSKLVLAYFNVAQAESYRTSWGAGWRAPTADAAGHPPFLIGDDPDGWADNYPVAFWDPDWPAVLWGRPGAPLDAILADGFDGVYLDWVLAFCDPSVLERAAADGVDAADAMIAHLDALARYARARRPGFLIVAQNGAPLGVERPALWRIADAVAQESLSFSGAASGDWDDPANGDVASGHYVDPTEPEWAVRGGDPPETSWCLHCLQVARAAGLVVLTLDYAREEEHARLAERRSLRHGFVPFVSRTPLDRLPALR